MAGRGAASVAVETYYPHASIMYACRAIEFSQTLGSHELFQPFFPYTPVTAANGLLTTY